MSLIYKKYFNQLRYLFQHNKINTAQTRLSNLQLTAG